MKRVNIVVFTGSGISADSGIPTYRSEDGLWANYRIEDVCTPRALKYNWDTVIEFYNQRRKESMEKAPNAGHLAIARLEKNFEVHVVTQNVDNLHEKAGSTDIVHLHGELMKLRSMADPSLVVDIEGWEQRPDQTGPDGALLRPHIVFFEESVPMFEPACRIVREADILIITGTSLAVYPAASLVQYVRDESVPIFVVDPGNPDIRFIRNRVTHIKARAAEGLPQLADKLEKEFL